MATRERIIGTIVFRNDGDGCLSAKYLNNGTRTPFADCCKRMPNSIGNGFVGEYYTVWVESHEPSISGNAKLIITEIEDDGRPTNTFKLEWQIGDTLRNIFTGKAMMYGELLVGYYQTES